MALSLKRLGKRFLEEINPFDGKGGLDFNKPVKRQSVSQSAPLLKPQVQQRQFNQPRNIFQAPVDRPQFKQPQYQAPTDPIRAKQAQQVQELTDRFRAGQITDEQRQTATQAVLGTQPKAVVKLKGVKGGVESVKDRSLFDAQQQEGYRQAIKPVTSRLQKTQDWVNSSDKKAGFQWDSAGDYGRFAANLIPGMAQGLIEAPIKTGQGVSGERVKNGKVEKMNLVQRGGALADSVISTAGLGIGGSATLLKGAAGGLVKTGLKETARKILKDAGVEGTEELVQAFANDLSDDGTINTDPKAYAQAFGLGALGGGMMSGAGKGTQAVRNNLETNIPKIANDNRGIVAGPLAGDFSKQKQAGRVFEGVDGKPRFEVSDEGAKLRPEAFNPTNKLTDLEALKAEARKYKSAEEFTQAIQDGKVSIPKGSPEQIAAIQKQLGMNWDEAYKTPTGVYDMQKKVANDLYNQATAPQVGKTPTNIYDYNPTLLEQNRKLRLEQATGQSYADKFGVSPDQEITIYRGVPENAKGKITAGDWVTHDKEQARQFARQHKDGSKILTQKVKAGDIRYTADNATGYADGEFVYKPTEVAPQVGKTDPINAIKAESKRFGYDKGYLEEGQIANTVDELMKEQNAVREVGIPLYDKYKDQLDGTKTVTEMMTPSELKAYKAAEAKSEKASKLLKDYFDYKRSAKSEVAPQVGKTATSKLASDILKNEDIVRSVMNGGVFKMRLDNGKVVAFGEKSLLGRLGDSIGDDVTDVIPVVIGRGKSGTAKSGQPRLLIDEFEGQNGMVQLKRALGETDEPKTTVSQRLRERWGEPQKNSPSVDTNLPKAVSSDSIPQSAPQVGKTNPNHIPPKSVGIRENVRNDGTSQDVLFDKRTGKDVAPIANNAEKADLIKNGYQPKEFSTPVAPVESKPTVTKKPTLQDALDGKSTKKVVESAVKPVVTAKTTKPKVALKEASSKKPKVELKEPKSIDEILYEDTPQFEERDKSLGQTLSPDRYIRENITQPLEQAINTGISKIPGVRRLAQGVSREAGVSPELLQQKRLLRGGVEKGKLVRESISELGDGLTIEQKTKAWATLDPEQASKVGIEQPTKLTARETQYRDKLAQIQTEITSGNLSRDLINEQQAANPSYIKRGYSVFEENSDASKAYNQTRQSLLKQFKGRKDVNEDLIDSAITDPGYLVAKKAAESQAAWAMVDYGNYLVESGLASDTKQSGMRQLPNSKIYGEAAGKYVPINVSEDFTGFQYNNGVINAYNDLITAYDNLGIRKAKKELLTVFNPAVRVGNQFSNRVVFANMNGINPIQFEQNYLEAGKQISEKGQLYREAIEQGLTGIDVTQADFAERIAQYADDPNMAIRAIEWTKKSYSAADDKARIAAYITHRKRGYSPDEAASLTQRGFQDYKSVGFFYDAMAKTPFIGNAFVRFAGDAIRIAKNAAVDHPLRSVATIALWSTFTGAMSRLSGESEEDKKTREQRFGAPSIPFTDISMTVQTPFGEVNVARFLPFYQLNDIQSPLARFSPIQANPLNPQGWQDPLLGQVGQLIADKDFRGKSIKDPENTGQFNDELPKDQQLKNQARFVATQNVPLGREADALISASQGKPDIYGKTRSVPQALGRAGGVKIEQFGPKEAEKTRQTNAYFKEKERIDKEIAGLPKKEQEAYKRLTGYSKLREQVDNEFDPGTKRYKKAPVYDFPEDKWKDYSPGLYDKIKKFKERENKKQGTPIQPEFDERLSKEFRKQLINNKSLAPGEDVEADARMYSSSEWDTYEQIKQEYKDAASKYYPDDGKDDFVDELVKHKSAPFPVKGPAKKAYDDAYKLYNKGKGPKPAYNDQVDAEKEAYNNAKLDWTNVERKARGLGPISKEVWDNVTFGFSSDEEKVYKQLKYGKGYGGGKGGRGRGGGKGSQGVGSAYKYAIDLNAGGAVAKPKVKVAKAGPAPVAKKSGGKPKVSLKKSKV